MREGFVEDCHERCALYSLGAMEPEEARRFEEHLERCKTCQAELAGYMEVVGLLALDGPKISPPSSLRHRLLERIAAEARIPYIGARRRSVNWLLLAAASLLITTLALTVALFRAERELGRLRARVKEIEEINSVLRSPGTRIIHMAGQQSHSGGVLYWDTQNNRWVISVGLPPPPPGKVYQLWFVTPEAKISAGLIHTDANGHGFATVRVPPEMTQIAAAAITLEPAGGSHQPTMPIYAMGKIE